MTLTDKEYYEAVNSYTGVLAPRTRAIDYVDPSPKPFITQISLVEYFERMTRWKADPWQVDLCNRLQAAAEGRHIKGVDQLFHAEPQLGKPLDVETQVLMGDGSYKRLGDVRVGDHVIGHTGLPRKVLQVHEQGPLECLELTTGCDRSVISALEHPFLTPEGWVQAQDLKPGDALGCVAEACIPGAHARSCEEFEMLGYFIGDGTCGNNACAITSGDALLTERILGIAQRLDWNYIMRRKLGANCDTIYFSNGGRQWLRDVGIAGTNSWTKRVPSWVFTGSQAQIAAFLGAYFACDGTFGRQRNTVIDFGSVSTGLLQDVQKLLLRVGVQSRLALKNGVYKGMRHQSHRLYFCSQDFVAQFVGKVPIYGRKGVELQAMRRHRKTFHAVYLADQITTIEPVGLRECRCLEVEVDHTFTANDFIVHNTIVVSQHLPAWLFGHDPLFRFALAMYNTVQSEKHSKVVIRILSSALHKDIFPNRDGWIYGDAGQKNERPVQAAVSGWYTNAGRGNEQNPGNAGQFSFNPVGLVSGLTGSGFSWLFCDDPYRSEKDAFSPTVNESIRDFLDFLESRRDLHSNLSLMFHRYAYDDAAAYCLDKGGFDYVRYASECDGPYLHEATGEIFQDPLNREIGELISPRRGHDYYAKVKKNPRVWSSMNQGRPVAAGSEFFLVDKIKIRPAIQAIARRAECTVMVRAWDLAATEEAGDYSTAPLIGMSPDDKTTLFEMVHKQVESAGRDQLMFETAQRDGHDVVISIPIDPGAAGQTAFFHCQQLLQGFQVVGRATTGSKEDRARSYAAAVNSGDVDFIDDSELAEDAKWIDTAKKEMRQFLLSALTHDDTIDSSADGYNECFERIAKGLVIKNLKLARNLVTWYQFGKQFTPKGADKPIDQIPAHWTLYVGVKITPEATKANSAVIVARAPQNTNLTDTLFLVAEYKAYSSDFYELFDWIDIALDSYCQDSKNAIIWLHPDSEEYRPTIHQKLQRPVALFEGDKSAGISEINWYLRPRDGVINPFTEREQGCGLYALIADTSQFAAATDEYGLYAFRQEASTWGFTDKGEPSAAGAVLDCLRMICYCFRTSAAPKTVAEQVEDRIGKKLTVAAIEAMPDSPVKDMHIAKRLQIEKEIERSLTRPVRHASSARFGRK